MNDAKHILQDRNLENVVDDDNKMNEKVEIIDKQKYKQSVSECNKLRTFIKTLVVRNIIVLSEKYYGNIRTEYGEIIIASEISNGDDAISDFWNENNNDKVLNTRCGKCKNSLLTDYARNLSMSKYISRNLKENFHNYKQKHNVSLTLYHEKY